jgi:hypothetical protein
MYGSRPGTLALTIPTITPEIIASATRAGVYIRVAPKPWGPWSVPRLAYNARSTRYPGYCELLHFMLPVDANTGQLLIARELFGLSGDEGAYEFCGDRAQGRGISALEMNLFNGTAGGRGPNGLVDLGFEYGPGIIEPLTTPLPATHPDAPGVVLHWIMSTWVPYRVLLMKTTVTLANRGTIRLPIPTTFNPDACLFNCCVMRCDCLQGLCPP